LCSLATQEHNTDQIFHEQHGRANHLIHYNTNIVINHNTHCSINPQFCEKDKKKGIKLSESLLKKEKRFPDYHHSELVRHILVILHILSNKMKIKQNPLERRAFYFFSLKCEKIVSFHDIMDF
jgi:hypothetical protein